MASNIANRRSSMNNNSMSSSSMMMIDEPETESQYVTRILENMQQNMGRFQLQLNMLTRKLSQLENVQNNFIINSLSSTSASAALANRNNMTSTPISSSNNNNAKTGAAVPAPSAGGGGTKRLFLSMGKSNNDSKPSTSASGLTAVSKADILRLDARIDALAKDLVYMKQDYLSRKSSSLYDADQSWMMPMSNNTTSNTFNNTVDYYGDDDDEQLLDDDGVDDKKLLVGPPSTSATRGPTQSLLGSRRKVVAIGGGIKKTVVEHKQELDEIGHHNNYGAYDDDDQYGDDSQYDEDHEPMVVQPEIYMDDDESQYDDDGSGPVNNVRGGRPGYYDDSQLDDEDDSMMMDDDDNQQNVEFTEDDYESADDHDGHGPGQGQADDDSYLESSRFSDKGMRDNAIEYKINKVTGRHLCPLYPSCPVECLSRRNLMRHYHNVHAASRTFQCSYCGIHYARKDNLIKHYKTKHPENVLPPIIRQQPKAKQPQQRQQPPQQQQQRVHILVRPKTIQTQAKARASGLVQKAKANAKNANANASAPFKNHKCFLCGMIYNWKKNLNYHLKCKHGCGPDGQLLTLPPEVLAGNESLENSTIRPTPPSSAAAGGSTSKAMTTSTPRRPSTVASVAVAKSCKSPDITAEAAAGAADTAIKTEDVQNDKQCLTCFKIFTRYDNLLKHVATHKTELMSGGARSIVGNTTNTSMIVNVNTSTSNVSSSADEEFEGEDDEDEEEDTMEDDAHSLEDLNPDEEALYQASSNPKQCPICRKTFTRKEHVKRHMKLHRGNEKYLCVGCNKIYSRKDQLRQHQRQKHGGLLDGYNIINN